MLCAPHDVCAMLSSSLRCRAIYKVFNWVEFELSLSCIRIGVGTYKCAAPANWDRQASHAVFMSRRRIAFRFKWGVINYGHKEGIFSQNKTLSLNVRSSISTAAKELSISLPFRLSLIPWTPRIVDTVAEPCSKQTNPLHNGQSARRDRRINERVSGGIKDVASSGDKNKSKSLGSN